MGRFLYKVSKRLHRTCSYDIDFETMQKIIREHKDVLVIDVRTSDEFKYNHLKDAINIPMQNICEKIGRYAKSKNDIIIVYCEYGGRSKKAFNKLQKLGYTNVYNLDGGIEAI